MAFRAALIGRARSRRTGKNAAQRHTLSRPRLPPRLLAVCVCFYQASLLLLSVRCSCSLPLLVYVWLTDSFSLPVFPPHLFIMFRSAVVRSLRAASMPRAVRTPAAFQLPVARPTQFAPRFAYQGVRLYSAPAGLNKEEVEGRIVNLLKNFDKVGSLALYVAKVAASANVCW